jgi:radical SAM protein with 4Fe4S-binding SPASM domain
MKIKNPFQELYERCTFGVMREKINNIPDFPRMIDVELTAKCNFRCAMCPVGQKRVKREQGDMSLDTLMKVLQQAKRYRTPIRYIRWGEPMMSPIFKDAIIQTKRHKLMCHVNTNGWFMNEDMAYFLIEEKLDSIKFSFQGVTPRSYSIWRRKNFFDELIMRIKMLRDIRSKMKADYPYIQVGTTIQPDTRESAIESFKKVVGRYADDVYVSTTMDLESKRNADNYCECPEVFDKMSVDWDGKVVACCGDYDKFMVVGDIHQDTLKDIWRSAELNRIRNKLSRYEHGDFELCSRCARSQDNEMR